MAINNFKSFGIGAGANVTSQANYEALAALVTGFQSGKASSAQINKALRQSSTMAYVLAQFISDSASVDVLDNGTPATILANLKAAMTALTPGRLINIQTITSTGTYTPTPGTKKIIVEMVGGGAGGAPAAAPNSTTGTISGGGGAGAYAKFRLDSVPSSVSVTVGTGGASGADGGQTVFGAHCTAPGGRAGNSGSTTGSTPVTVAGGNGGTTPSLSSQAIAISLSPGSGGEIGTAARSSNGSGGSGGSTPLSQGGWGAPSGAGLAAGGYGSGGGGCFGQQGASFPSGIPGGAGGSGVIIVYEYA